MSAIKPFKAIESPQRNKLATRKWTTKFLRMVLGKLNITGQGIAIKQTGDGHLHFELDNGDAASHPFKITRTGTTIQVAPGLVYSAQFTTTNGWLVPAIGSTYLTANPPPFLAFSGSVGFVCLVAEFDVNGAALNLPWKVDVFGGSAPEDIGLVRLNSLGAARPGKYHILLASFDGNGVHQWVQRNILINLQWEQPFIWA